MSKNRENITWPAADGTWNTGFWSFEAQWGHDGDDYDDEWDVEYSGDSFWWAASGLSTPEAGREKFCKTNCNPGGGWTISDRNANLEECVRLDGILAAFKASEAKRPRTSWSW